ncbi:glycosyltransferase [Methylogaea oryzae]|uniref:glycosyltransferase n=1 Tax=Methylogaea oryzae TaxID=1295382 RepID=UPI0020D068C9|nr:hypothetical protein [Methylogaea oryzae]
MADTVIDTYPTGGGYALAEAMALGIPTLLFKNDYEAPFDPVNWSPMEEYVDIPELLLERGDFEHAGRLIAKLAADADYRHRLGQQCRDTIQAQSDPATLVRQCEDIYLRRIAERSLSPDNSGLPTPCAAISAIGSRSRKTITSSTTPATAACALSTRTSKSSRNICR